MKRDVMAGSYKSSKNLKPVRPALNQQTCTHYFYMRQNLHSTHLSLPEYALALAKNAW